MLSDNKSEYFIIKGSNYIDIAFLLIATLFICGNVFLKESKQNEMFPLFSKYHTS